VQRDDLGPGARLALDTIEGRPTTGIPSWMLHVMEHSAIERLAGAGAGDYRREPERVYLAFQRAIGTCMLDQYIPDNPLTMGDRGYEGAELGPTTGASRIVVDDMLIDSPEAVCAHMEGHLFPAMSAEIASFDESARVREILDYEAGVQAVLGPGILKAGHSLVRFPGFRYGLYGYANYFMAYALYPEVVERDFALQADLSLLHNTAAARAYVEGPLPLFCRMDHDMADSRGTLASVESLERLWLPHFARCIAPAVDVSVRLIWHCDGNLMKLFPLLLQAGVVGFQGFQYECGMDYERICRMKTRGGEPLLIIAGVSVTRTLPFGTPDDVRSELDWLVRHGPPGNLLLGGTSTITPGVPLRNIEALVEGLRYYRTHSGR